MYILSLLSQIQKTINRFGRLKNGCVFALLLLLFNNSGLAQLAALKDIEIKSVSNSVETFIAVQCDKFDSSFSSQEMKERAVTDSATLESLRLVLGKIQYRKGESGIDVRAKFYFHFVDETKGPIVICMDKFDIVEVDGQSIKTNKKLIRLLRKLRYEGGT